MAGLACAYALHSWCAGRREGLTSTSVGVLGGRRRQEQDSILGGHGVTGAPEVVLWNVETSGTVTHRARDSRTSVCEPCENTSASRNIQRSSATTDRHLAVSPFMTPGRTDLAQAWTALRGLVLAKAVFHVEHPAARCRVAGSHHRWRPRCCSVWHREMQKET